ncbi:MAG: NUDIX hydrolase, partial [Oscillospiraceae bacterium]|nr:NUDIX hydrolase [Oscillospiraceae bacterium]
VCHDSVLLENGETALREVVYHNGGVCVLPLTDSGEVIFVKQFRYPYKEEVLELPAGKLNLGEDPFESAVRELKEETGAEAKKYTPLGRLYPSPGYCGEIITMYLAEELSFGEQNLDEDEFLDTVKIPFEKAVEMVLAGEIPDAKTQTALLKAKLMLK